jgi:hypothetical protein
MGMDKTVKASRQRKQVMLMRDICKHFNEIKVLFVVLL